MKKLFIRASFRSLLAVSAIGLALCSLAGCSDGPDTDTDPTTTTDSTGSSGSTETTGSSGSTATTGSTGSTTVDDPPVELGMTKIGSPLWEPVDYHQFSVAVGPQFENYGVATASLLPPPNHEVHQNLGVGPGAAHAGPYDTEVAAGVTAQGYEEHTTFSQVDGLLPNAIMAAWMMVPSAGAPEGTSPDSAAGPIIDNTLFPIHVKVDSYLADVLLDGYSYEFDVPALDAQLDPPFDVEGHSHFPMFAAAVFDGLPQPTGTIETRVSMVDAAGDGWDLTLTFIAAP